MKGGLVSQAFFHTDEYNRGGRLPVTNKLFYSTPINHSRLPSSWFFSSDSFIFAL